MGLTIYYSGNFKPNVSISEMIEEVKDIAQIYKWKYHIFETKFPENNFDDTNFNEEIYGISFSPPSCEPVLLCFLSNGRMANPFMFQHWLQSKAKNDEHLIYGNFTKTQYAGIEIHKQIIHLLKHLGKKYLMDFKVNDEGGYWATEDENVLQDNFNRYTDLIENFSSSIQNHPKKDDESFEAYFERLLKQFRSKI